MDNWGILKALAFEPRRAFAELYARPRFWVPLVALIVGSVGMVVWYQSAVDVEWLTDQQLRANPRTSQLTDAQIESIARAAASRPGVRISISAVAVAIGTLIFTALSALYLLLAGKITNVQAGYRQWFALTCWTSLPGLLSLLPASINLLSAETSQIPPAAIQPLSLNALFLNRPMDDPGYAFFGAINLTMFVSIYLLAGGIKEWSRRTWLFAAVIAALPFVLVFGVWGYQSLGRQ